MAAASKIEIRGNSIISRLYGSFGGWDFASPQTPTGIAACDRALRSQEEGGRKGV